MKKYLFFIAKCFVFIFIVALFSGCVKDTITQTSKYSWYVPVYKTKDEVIADIKSSPEKSIENPGKIFIIGKYIFLSEVGSGVHVIDNTDPSIPKNIAFINIPGNVDIALKGTTLYADFYNDMITLDVSNPLNVGFSKIIKNAFPNSIFGSYGYGADSNMVIANWIRHDTIVIGKFQPQSFPSPGGIVYDNTLSPNASQNYSTAGVTGIAGSMSRFAIANNYLYTVGYNDLNVFNISTPANPTFDDTIATGSWNIETIFPFRNKLFIGSQSGMFIYNIDNPGTPMQEGQFGHVMSCDPVIADDSYAYVTLRSGSACQGFTNELEILSLQNLTNPTLVKSYKLTNPRGLSKDGNLLFICDGADGLKIYDAADANNLKLIKNFTAIETYDVIANDNIALVVAKDGLYQFDYSNPGNIHLISKINITK